MTAVGPASRHLPPRVPGMCNSPAVGGLPPQPQPSAGLDLREVAGLGREETFLPWEATSVSGDECEPSQASLRPLRRPRPSTPPARATGDPGEGPRGTGYHPALLCSPVLE